MKICLPCVNDRGLDARLSPHFGSAPYFTVVDGETGAVEVTANAHAVHDHGSCNPAGALVGLGVDVVVCRGLGGRALALLEQQGITVYRTEDWAAADAVNAFRVHRLPVMTLAHSCQHGH